MLRVQSRLMVALAAVVVPVILVLYVSILDGPTRGSVIVPPPEDESGSDDPVVPPIVIHTNTENQKDTSKPILHPVKKPPRGGKKPGYGNTGRRVEIIPPEVKAKKKEKEAEAFAKYAEQHPYHEPVVYQSSDIPVDALHKRFANEPGVPKLMQLFEHYVVGNTTGTCQRKAKVPWAPDNATSPWVHTHHTVTPDDLCIRPADLDMGTYSDYQTFDSFTHPLPLQRRPDSERVYMGEPFLDGLGFKMLADCVYESNNFLFSRGTSFRRSKCRLGDVKNRSLVYWYIDSYDLSKFKEKLIVKPECPDDLYFFLIVHNLDNPRFPSWLLDHHRILRVFSVNIPHNFTHPKLVPLPLGIPYRRATEVNGGRENASLSVTSTGPTEDLFARFKINVKAFEKHVNLTRGLQRLRRRLGILDTLVKNGFDQLTPAEVENRIPLWAFHKRISQHRYVLSPSGHGLDTYRTWQALYLGRVPVVERGLRPEVFDELPVMEVDDFSSITPDVLRKQWSTYQTDGRRYNLGRLWMKWWAAFILREILVVP